MEDTTGLDHLDWETTSSPLCQFVSEQSTARLRGYETLPGDIEEHAAIEQSIIDGGYGHRQLFELIQNAADAIRDAGVSGRIEVRLTDRYLYCANEGSPLREDGANAILHSHVSAKRGHEIGHFGLGFKSVLGISSHIGVYSRPGSFEFRTDEARRQILEAVPSYHGPTPGLRLAVPVDATAVAGQDRDLSELMEWATTVIRLARDRVRATDLGRDLAGFPAEFLLFSPHVSRLRLRDVEAGIDRLISLTAGPKDELLLQDGQQESAKWRVFRSIHEMSSAAREDAGEATARDKVEVAWAVPLERRRAAGQYWAFFPTTYESSLTGILNAPWKTNSDRQGLLEGLYNREIIDAGSRLIADSLAALYDESDPGAHLDLLPARIEDAEGWANRELTTQVYQHTSARPILPDSECRLQAPSLLTLPPRAAGEAALDVWNRLPSRPAGWAHARANTRERRPRALLLGAIDGTTTEWLDAIAEPATPDSCIAAIRAAVGCESESRRYGQTELPGSQASIVLTSGGYLVRPNPTAVFLNGSGQAPVTDVAIVHPQVEADGEARGILAERFGLRPVDPLIELEVLLREAKRPAFAGWEALWESVRRVPLPGASKLLNDNAAAFRVRTVAGSWVCPWEALLPGAIVPGDGSRDAKFAVDPNFHRQDGGALELLGVVEKPTPSGLRPAEFRHRVGWPNPNWQQQYHDDCVTRYQSQGMRTSGSRPQWGSISVSLRPLAGPISPYFGLSEAGKNAFVQALLPLAASEDPVVWYHDTRRNVYPDLAADSPARWLIRKHAAVPTSLGRRSPQTAVGPNLEAWKALLPVVQAECSFLDLPGELAELPQELVDAAYQATLSSEDLALVAAFYAEMALAGWSPPGKVRAIGPAGPVELPPANVLVTHEADLSQLLATEHAVLLTATPQHAAALVGEWGMQRADTEATVRYEASGPAIPLADVFPGLPISTLARYGDVEMVPCEMIWRERSVHGGTVTTGVTSQLLEVSHEFLYQVGLDVEEVLRELLQALSIELPHGDVERALRRRLDEQQQRRVTEIRELPSAELKLAALLGAERLQNMLPFELLRDAAPGEGALTPEALASMVLAIHGSAALQRSVLALEAAGFSPPRRWAGGDAALRFVRTLGFADDFAGAPPQSRPPYIEVDGPVKLPPLHDFQETIATRIGKFLGLVEPGRGLVSLPTGAGKTRVATESLTRAYRDGVLKGVVLWLADRQELCEQAVQSWREVWRAFGPEAPLRISRLWGDTNNAVEGVRESHHVVVATFQSLLRRLDRADFNWLTEASCVVIDEAHGSVTPSYTEILRRLDLTPRHTARPFIGLTATPFRGRTHDEGSETLRLVNRYGGNRFDHGVFEDDDPYPLLRTMGVLADAEFAVLEGVEFELSESELDQFETFDRLPSAVEARLGLDADRNARIVDRVKQLPRDWPTLVFATSLDHAELLAALLAKEGRTARAISSRTDPSARRNAIGQFRAGEIQVLTNYGVLTTGFDAPKIRALIVTRPIYSPGLYMQVVGRGLRGPRNGGTASCLIVNVEDNLLQYGSELAFRQFEHLWRRVRGEYY